MSSYEGYEQIGFAVTCRSWEEYRRMFVLNEEMLHQGPILDVAAGASSFTASALDKGLEAVAVDPLYDNGYETVSGHARAELAVSGEKIAAMKERMDWSYYGSYELYQQQRMLSLERFLASYGREDAGNCYIPAAMPKLPFTDNRFSLVLCSHFLFLYEQELDEEFHFKSCLELLRVCRPGGQIRIYPLFNLSYKPYSKLETILQKLETAGADITFEQSELPFIPGSKELVCITKAANKIGQKSAENINAGP